MTALQLPSKELGWKWKVKVKRSSFVSMNMRLMRARVIANCGNIGFKLSCPFH
jgi:hypothetical protein